MSFDTKCTLEFETLTAPTAEGLEALHQLQAMDNGDDDRSLVFKTEIEGLFRVSTVQLRAGLRWTAEFETLVFVIGGGWSEIAGSRWDTAEEAIEGHMTFVNRVRNRGSNGFGFHNRTDAELRAMVAKGEEV